MLQNLSVHRKLVVVSPLVHGMDRRLDPQGLQQLSQTVFRHRSIKGSIKKNKKKFITHFPTHSIIPNNIPYAVVVSHRNTRTCNLRHLGNMFKMQPSCIMKRETTSKGSSFFGLKKFKGQMSMYR